eukprot:980935-Rhodomonas_salina.1
MLSHPAVLSTLQHETWEQTSLEISPDGCCCIQQCWQRSSTENGSRRRLKSAQIHAVASSNALNAPARKVGAEVA